MHLEALLIKALPTADADLIEKAVGEHTRSVEDSFARQRESIRNDLSAIIGDIFARLPGGSSDDDGDSEEVAMLRGEIGRLKSQLHTHMEGVTGATQAGLDALGERARQRRMEGYDDAHDDKHHDFSLTSGAIAYLMDARQRGTTGHGFSDAAPSEWPWDRSDWKPKNLRQSLVVAVALGIAEIERLDRAGITD